jgi:hypothetical protein
LKNITGAGKFEAGCDDRIFVSSDKVISDELKQAFVSGVGELLEDVPETRERIGTLAPTTRF